MVQLVGYGEWAARRQQLAESLLLIAKGCGPRTAQAAWSVLALRPSIWTLRRLLRGVELVLAGADEREIDRLLAPSEIDDWRRYDEIRYLVRAETQGRGLAGATLLEDERRQVAAVLRNKSPAPGAHCLGCGAAAASIVDRRPSCGRASCAPPAGWGWAPA